MSKHEKWMQEALILARVSTSGFSAPNPHVGCVIVKQDEIVGSGHSDPAGGAHAEINALRLAGESAQGASVYVTLEPCNHHGRTGPCSQALIDAGVREVFYAAPDPSPVACGGAQALSGAGIKVVGGLMKVEAREVHRQFLYSIHTGRPFVTVKAGISLDGRIALPSGESQWITSETARNKVQLLRAERGCVLIGGRTALVDQARLTVRELSAVKQPTRVVIDSRGTLPETLPVFDEEAPSIRFTPQPKWAIDRPISAIPDMLGVLKQEGINGVLVEGGAKTISRFIQAGVVDEIILYVAPIILGAGPSWTSELGVETLANAPRFVLANSRTLDEGLIQANQEITLYSRNLSDFITSE
jgi:diaminohydroxyphosphoribosylaminopyrimidine deaminase/5-amino-6-(5-phosphoribosylamino)uracil reductase